MTKEADTASAERPDHVVAQAVTDFSASLSPESDCSIGSGKEHSA